jgi:murein L,D-transpeptidase YafK
MYRKTTPSKIEKELNKTLSQKSYWDRYLKDKNVSNGYYESINYLLICDKDLKQISILKKDKNSYDEIFNSKIIIGKEKGDKSKEGDLKTPVGVYNITKKISKIEPFYGPFALVTSYPNGYDKSLGKTGHGIWLHGVPQDKKRNPYSKGCIVLKNKPLEELANKIDLKKTILIIDENQNNIISKDTISTILSNLYIWKLSWIDNDLDKYLSFYNIDFKKSNGMNLEEFKKYKERIFNKKEKKSIIFTNINIIPYPNELNKQIFKILLYERYKTKNYYFNGKKALYIEFKNNTFTILSES